MSEISRLYVTLGANTKEFQQAMDNVGQRMQNVGKRVGQTGKSMTKWVTGPIVAAGAGVIGLGVKMGNTADEILDLESATGMSAEAIQEWRAVADRAGVSTDAVAKASEMLTKSMSRGAEGSADMRLAMEELGLSMDEVREMSPDERMETLITSLQGVDDAGRRAELGNRLMRNGYQELAPILDMTNEEMEGIVTQAHESGRVMDGEALEAADNFRKGLDELKGEFMGLFYSVGENVIPILVDELLPAIQENIIPMMRDLGEWISKAIEWFVDLDPTIQMVILGAIGLAAALGPVLMVLGPIITGIGALIPLFGAILSPIGLKIAAIAALVAGIAYLWHTNEGFRDAVMAIWERIKDFFQSVIDAILAWWDEWGDDILAFATDTWEQVEEVIGQAIEMIKLIIENALNHIEIFWDTWGDSIISLWKFLWDLVSGILETAWELIKDIVSGALDIISGILDVFIGIFTGDWERMWEGLKGIATGAANILIGIVNSVIGAFESMVNAVRGAINRIPSFDIPSWVPGIGGNSYSLPTIPRANLPRIPTLHSGTDYFVPPGGGMEGLALLQRGEQVIPRGEGGKMEHSGTITVKGVNNQGEMMGAVDLIIEGLDNPKVRRKLDSTIYDTERTNARGRGDR